MKKIFFLLLCATSMVCVSCKDKKAEEVLPDFSGRYNCSLFISMVPKSYSASSDLVITKSATGNDYSVSGSGIFSKAKFSVVNTTQVQVSLPQVEFTHNNATCYLSFWVTLDVLNGNFTPYNGQIVFGEKGISSKIYSPKEASFRFSKK